MLEKLSLSSLISFLTVVLLLRKFIVYSSFKMLELPFSSKLDRGSCIISIAKTTSKKIGALIRFSELLSPEIALYIFKSITRSCMGYCGHFWVVPLSYYLKLLDKLQKRICRTVHPSLPVSLEPLVHCRNGASFSLFFSYYTGRCSSELVLLALLPYFWKKSTRYSEILDFIRMPTSTVSLHTLLESGFLCS